MFLIKILQYNKMLNQTAHDRDKKKKKDAIDGEAFDEFSVWWSIELISYEAEWVVETEKYIIAFGSC